MAKKRAAAKNAKKQKAATAGKDAQVKELRSRVQSLEEELQAKGTGLGLYIVKTLVESLGGSVEVENRVPGDFTRGARFVVYLPAGEC